MKRGRATFTTVERIQSFWSKVNRSNACWQWTGLKNKGGYGIFWSGTKQIAAHRFAYLLANGEIPKSPLFVLHRCENPECVRPEHLYAATALDNAHDLYSGPHKPHYVLAHCSGCNKETYHMKHRRKTACLDWRQHATHQATAR